MAATDQGIAQGTVWEKFSISLPHPYLTRYHAQPISKDGTGSTYRISLASPEEQGHNEPPFLLHGSDLSFSSLAQGHDITIADNTAWARARRSPSTTFAWTSVAPPTIAQLWLLVYSYFTVHYSEETIRLDLVGTQAALARDELIAVGLAIPHPAAIDSPGAKETWTVFLENEILLLRSSFWQGAGSPFGTRPVWLPVNDNSSRQPLHTFPLLPATQTITTKFPSARVHTLHPIRPAKPTPGSLIYSRYIPHLGEHFSMVALDYKDPEHLNLFHIWQNDPRVAAGWNESGTIEHHTKYLKDLHEDPHVLTILAKFDDTPFAYFEVYWGKVNSHLPAMYP